jgi:hypothetical protein
MTWTADPRVDAYIDACPAGSRPSAARSASWSMPPTRGHRDHQAHPPALLRPGGQHLRPAGGQGPRQHLPVRRRQRPPRPGGHHHRRPPQQVRPHRGHPPGRDHQRPRPHRHVPPHHRQQPHRQPSQAEATTLTHRALPGRSNRPVMVTGALGWLGIRLAAEAATARGFGHGYMLAILLRPCLPRLLILVPKKLRLSAWTHQHKRRLGPTHSAWPSTSQRRQHHDRRHHRHPTAATNAKP